MVELPPSFLVAFSALSMAGLAGPSAAAAPPPAPSDALLPSPWAEVPIGTTLTFEVVSDTVLAGGKPVHAVVRETWVVAQRDASVVIVLASGGDYPATEPARRLRIPLTPVAPEPARPSGEASGQVATRAGARAWAGEEELAVPFGGPGATVHCTIYRESTDPLESSTQQREWKNPAYPVPLKVVAMTMSGGVAANGSRSTRTLVGYEVPRAAGPELASWAGVAVGTRYVFAVTEHRESGLATRNPAPADKMWQETWTLTGRDAAHATVRVTGKPGDAPAGSTLTFPRVAETSVASQSGTAEEHDEVRVAREALTTKLGTFDAVHVTHDHTMNEADGRTEAWRAAAYPVPVRQVKTLRAKQSSTTTVRELVAVKPAH